MAVGGDEPTLTFTSRGTYFATLEVEDATGNSGQAIITISVRDAIPPKAVAGEDRTVFVETLVTLDGNGSSDDVGVINWTWSYYLNGQQVVRYGRTTAVVFHETGTIVVKLKVRDAAGNEDETTFFMSVEEPPDEPTDDDGPSGLTASILVIIAVVVSVVVALRVLARRR